jgi:hypothetical protein
MAHYSLLNENNVVVDVITGLDEDVLIEGLDPETWYGQFHNLKCKRTSYNTAANIHRLGGIPFRKNYGYIGMIYDEDLDAFIHPKIHESWILDEETGVWNPPIPRPTEGWWIWDEDTLSWIEQTI